MNKTDIDLSSLDAFIEEAKFTGVVEVRRGEVSLFAGAYGEASPRWAIPNTFDMRFDVASISKLFTAVATLQLVDKGVLDLDESIHEYADLEGTAISREVTLRQVLTHSSGIADIAEEEDGEDYATVFAEFPCHLIVETSDWLKIFANKPANFPPGTKHRYCNAGFILAGLAVERASGLGFRDYAHEHVLAAAGMSRSAYFDKRYAVPDLAEGFDPDEEGRLEQNIYAYPPVGHADGGAFCTAGDLFSFLAAVRNGSLLSADMTEAFFIPQLPAPESANFRQGFGLEFKDDRWWKEGGSEGASGIVEHFSASDLDLVVLSNTEEGAWPVITEIERLASA